MITIKQNDIYDPSKHILQMREDSGILFRKRYGRTDNILRYHDNICAAFPDMAEDTSR